MQYRKPVGSGPSLNTCPRCASHSLHFTSRRTSPKLMSLFSYTFSAAIGFQKLGQPAPESNFVVEANRALSQSTQRYSPSACSLSSAPVNAHSVPARRVTSYCSGLSCFFHSSVVLRTFAKFTTPNRVPSSANFTTVTGPESVLAGSSSANAARQTRCTPISSPYDARVAVPKMNPRRVRSFIGSVRPKGSGLRGSLILLDRRRDDMLHGRSNRRPETWWQDRASLRAG